MTDLRHCIKRPAVFFYMSIFSFNLFSCGPHKEGRVPKEASHLLVAAAEIYNTPQFADALTKINEAAADSREHVIALGRDDKNNILCSEMMSGTRNSSMLPDVKNRFADLHNHPNDAPPHSGDIYAFIERCLKDQWYKIKFVVTRKGSLYALVLVDSVLAKTFLKIHPKESRISGYQPVFPSYIVDEERMIRLKYGTPADLSVAFILSKYNTGVDLLKLNNRATFERLSAIQRTDPRGDTIYVSANAGK